MSLCKFYTGTREVRHTGPLNCEDGAAKDLRDQLEDALIGGCPTGCYDPLWWVGHAKPLGMPSHGQHLALDDGTDLCARNHECVTRLFATSII